MPFNHHGGQKAGLEPLESRHVNQSRSTSLVVRGGLICRTNLDRFPGPFLRPVGVVTMVHPQCRGWPTGESSWCNHSSATLGKQGVRSGRLGGACRSVLSHILPMRKNVIGEVVVVTRSRHQTLRYRTEDPEVETPRRHRPEDADTKVTRWSIQSSFVKRESLFKVSSPSLLLIAGHQGKHQGTPKVTQPQDLQSWEPSACPFDESGRSARPFCRMR
ncbi:hypothetical protein B0H65DRAFT_80312 [Neurospora tetraspora]|uniref:Uncharacterized protein n=1 Tax=Neurospora tetraspora TaxID=94610 RepID=A0AAE0MJ33_9PEZI|nr:hypothetical protein B0H65DRAFT_80312 [Neurospora tetraspora]